MSLMRPGGGAQNLPGLLTLYPALFQFFLATAMCTRCSEVCITSRVFRAHEKERHLQGVQESSKQRRSC